MRTGRMNGFARMDAPAFMILSSIIYGVIPSLAKQAVAQSSGPLMLLCFRGAFMAIGSIVTMGSDLRLLALSKRELRDLIICSLVEFFAAYTYILSYMYIPVGLATILNFLYPIFAVVICVAIYRDAVTKTGLLAVALGITGIVLILGANRGGDQRGLWLGILSGILYGIYTVYSKHSLVSAPDVRAVTAYGGFVVALMAGVIMLLNKAGDQTLQIHPAPLIAIGILNLLGTMSYHWSIRRLRIDHAMALCSFEPLASYCCGIIVFGDKIGLCSILGCLLIIGGAILSSEPGQPRRRKNQTGANTHPEPNISETLSVCRTMKKE